MGKTRGVDLRRQRDYGRYRDRGRVRPIPGEDTAAVHHQRVEHRIAANWRVKALGNGQVLAMEPGGNFETVFDADGGPEGDLFWEAVQFAASCLRGETAPAALP